MIGRDRFETGALALALTASLLSIGPAPTMAQSAPQIMSVAFNPTGTVIAVGGYRAVSLFDSASGLKIARLSGHAGNVTSVQYSPNGKWLAASGGLPGRSGEVKLWDLSARSNPTSRSLSGPSDVVQCIAFSPDGQQLAAASYDHDITVWSLSKPGSKPRVLKDHIDSVYAVAFSPNGKLLASAGGDRTVKLWSAATGKRLYTLSESTAEVYALAFRPDGKQIAAGGADKQLRTWNIDTAGGSLAKSAFAHDGAILRINYSGDGRAIFTSGEDNAVKRWDSASLVERRAYQKLPDWPQGIALSPNGKLLAVGCQNGLLALYDINSGKLVREMSKGVPVASKNGEMPRTSAIPGRRLGDNKQRRPVNDGGVTLFAASLGDIAPRGAKRGGTVRFTLFGGLVSDASGVFFDDPAITGKIVTPADSNAGVLRVDATIGSGARIGVHRVFLQTPHGSTGSVPFAVGGWPEVAQVEPNNTAEGAQKIAVPCTMIGALDSPGDIDCYRVEAKAGQELVFEVVAQALRSRLQPILTLTDQNGNVLAESGARIGRPDTLLGYRFPADGSYILQLRDYESAGGSDVHYRLNIGEFPVVTDVFPLGVRAGTTTQVEVQGFNLGGVKTAHVMAPADSEQGRSIAISLETQKGPLVLSRPVQVGLDEEVLRTAGNESSEQAQRIQIPCALNGRLAAQPSTLNPQPGLSHFYRFHAAKGERLTLEVLARRDGSSLDPEIEVLDAAGKPIERAVARPVFQTEMTLSDRDSASNGFRIVAWDGVGIGDYLMIGREIVKVVEMPRGPDSDIFVRNFRGQRLTYFDTTPEYHSVAQPVYKVEVHPPGASFSPNGYPVTRLTYRNDDGGALFGKDSRLEFVAPADGDYIVRIGDTRGQQGPDYTYRLLIHPPRPDFKLSMSPEHPNVPKAGAVVVSVECERRDGFDGAIQVSAEGLPKGFTATPAVIEEGQTSASLLISADPNATTPAPSGTLRIVGKASIGGNVVVRTIEPDNGVRLVTVLPPPDARVASDHNEVVIRPGQEVFLEVRLDRQGKFGGRVPIEVKNLPFGVQVQNIGLNGILVTEQDTTRKVAIKCEPWVKPQSRAFFLVANIEGGAPSAGIPILLRVVGTGTKGTSAARLPEKQRSDASQAPVTVAIRGGPGPAK
jgi:WD40 repeat protein